MTKGGHGTPLQLHQYSKIKIKIGKILKIISISNYPDSQNRCVKRHNLVMSQDFNVISRLPLYGSFHYITQSIRKPKKIIAKAEVKELTPNDFF